MLKSIKYVLKENFSNLFRIYSISKYELLSDMRDSKLGIFWNFANPFIQILTYYFDLCKHLIVQLYKFYLLLLLVYS